MKFSDQLGTVFGYPLGWFTGSIAFLRQSRMFHPRGLTFRAEITPIANDARLNLKFHSHGLVRLSSAWWKQKEWRDVLGIAIRFSKSEIVNEIPRSEDQDLLFATIEKPWQLFISPFLTHYHDFFENDYFAVSPFQVNGKKVFFKLKPVDHLKPSGETRRKKLEQTVFRGQAGFEIQVQEENAEYTTVAKMVLTAPITLNQEELKFSPFRDGLGFKPSGFVHHLRLGAYYFSQKLRPHS